MKFIKTFLFCNYYYKGLCCWESDVFTPLVLLCKALSIVIEISVVQKSNELLIMPV